MAVITNWLCGRLLHPYRGEKLDSLIDLGPERKISDQYIVDEFGKRQRYIDSPCCYLHRWSDLPGSNQCLQCVVDRNLQQTKMRLASTIFIVFEGCNTAEDCRFV